METVEKAAASIPVAQPEEATADSAQVAIEMNNATDTPESAEQAATNAAAQSTSSHDPAADVWSGLLQTGLSFLEQLASTRRPDTAQETSPDRSARPGLSFVRRDAKSGEPYLHLPVPSADVLDRFLGLAGDLLKRFQK